MSTNDPTSRDGEIRLGLIGDNIAASSAPRLHRLAGRLCGLSVRYDRLVPRDLGLDFAETFAQAQAEGLRGLNITYPYKERVLDFVRVEDDVVTRLGAVNTVVFEAGGAVGWNTDFTGFIAAYEQAFGSVSPGRIGLIGTGGVGRAIAFGLARLGATELLLTDLDASRAQRMAADLSGHVRCPITVVSSADALRGRIDGIVNCTPVGMVGHEGTPFRRTDMAGAAWAFDAIYTPVDTQFLRDAADAGLKVVSGYELFFWQGVHAWTHFTGLSLDPAALRRALEGCLAA